MTNFLSRRHIGFYRIYTGHLYIGPITNQGGFGSVDCRFGIIFTSIAISDATDTPRGP